MVTVLGDEQKSDDQEKAQLDKSEDERKVLEQTSADLEKSDKNEKG